MTDTAGTAETPLNVDVEAVTFYRSWEAFPHTKMDGQPDTITVNVSPNGPNQGGNYGFVIEHAGTERNREPIALRVKMFADAWRAFADLPEFFGLLASMDESQRPAGGRERAPRTTLDDLVPHLLGLGWADITNRYASTHTHLMGCLTCGKREHLTSTAPTAVEEGDRG